LIKGYDQKDICNADETGLFYNLLPSKRIDIKSDTCHGGKKSKVRLTVLLCANTDGFEKLFPLIIGKSKKSHCFKNVKALPTKYLSNKKSWMTMSYIIDGLKGLDDKMRKQKRRIILFIDQRPAHLPYTDFLKNITVKIFPVNFSSKLQPLDLGVIKSLKQRYRKLLVKTTIVSLDHGDTKNMKIDVLQTMNFIMMAWQNVLQKTIKNCFALSGFLSPVDINPIENDESDHFVPPENWSNLSDVTAFEVFVHCDSELATCSLLTIDEMIANEETSSEEEDNCTEKPLQSFQQALEGLNTMQQYLISSDLNDKVKMALLTEHNELLSVHSKKALQPKITKYIL
ncbi:Tigger transposable element-derived protein 6, partial [Araneus ventricosus]